MVVSDDELIAEIQRLTKDGEPPTQKKFDREAEHGSSATARNHFGSWNAAIKQAGFSPRSSTDVEPVSKDDLITEIQRLAENGEPPTQKKFDREAEHGSATVHKKFGSWNTGVREAGFSPNLEAVTDDDLIAEIQRLAEDDIPPTKEVFEEDSKHGCDTVLNHFNSWAAGVREAGFLPNNNLSDSDLIKALADDASGATAPDVHEFDGRYSKAQYIEAMGWWDACVRAGLCPQGRRPLRQTNWDRFFHTARSYHQPRYQLIALLAQLTGLSVRMISEMSMDWITERDDDVLVTVPECMTEIEDNWTFRVPQVFTDRSNKKHKTGLDKLLVWYLNRNQNIIGKSKVSRAIYQVAAEAGLEDREMVQRKDNHGTVPLVRLTDLRMTGGIQMARNGAPASRIRQHLGIEYTGWRVSVDDFFLWCHVNDENFNHADSEVGGIYLDPDTGDMTQIESNAN